MLDLMGSRAPGAVGPASRPTAGAMLRLLRQPFKPVLRVANGFRGPRSLQLVCPFCCLGDASRAAALPSPAPVGLVLWGLTPARCQEIAWRSKWPVPDFLSFGSCRPSLPVGRMTGSLSVMSVFRRSTSSSSCGGRVVSLLCRAGGVPRCGTSWPCYHMLRPRRRDGIDKPEAAEVIIVNSRINRKSTLCMVPISLNSLSRLSPVRDWAGQVCEVS